MRDSKKGSYAFIYCIGSAKGLYACIYWKKWRFGGVTPIPQLSQLSQLHCIIIQGGKACGIDACSDAKLQEESRGVPGKPFNHFDSDGKSNPLALIILMFLLIDG